MSLDLPGFADPVAGAQVTFRAVLDALSRPGTVSSAGEGLAPPRGMDAATAAVLLTLLDAETALWLDPAFAGARDWIAFHCGARFTDDIGAADFVAAAALPEFSLLNAGTDEGPETSATVILQVASVETGLPISLTGAGIEKSTRLNADGLPGDFAARWAANRKIFPRGVDLILCAGQKLAALPRGIAVREG